MDERLDPEFLNSYDLDTDFTVFGGVKNGLDGVFIPVDTPVITDDLGGVFIPVLDAVLTGFSTDNTADKRSFACLGTSQSLCSFHMRGKGAFCCLAQVCI